MTPTDQAETPVVSPAPEPPATEAPSAMPVRGPAALELASALALEAAQKAVHCPTPPTVQAVIDAADPQDVAAGRAAIEAQQRPPRSTGGRRAAQTKTPE